MAKPRASFSKEHLLAVLSVLAISACDRSTAPKPEGAAVHEEALKASAEAESAPSKSEEGAKGAVQAKEVEASKGAPKDAQKGKAGSEGKCGEGRCGEGKCG